MFEFGENLIKSWRAYVILAKTTIKSHTDPVILWNSPRFQTCTKPPMLKFQMIRKLYQQMNTMIDLKLEIIKILKTSINAIKFQ